MRGDRGTADGTDPADGDVAVASHQRIDVLEARRLLSFAHRLSGERLFDNKIGISHQMPGISRQMPASISGCWPSICMEMLSDLHRAPTIGCRHSKDATISRASATT
jgi:hypothetical protein